MADALPNIVETASLIGMSIGMLVGGVACAAVSVATGNSPEGTMITVFLCMGAGAAVGAVIGGAIGKAIKTIKGWF